MRLRYRLSSLNAIYGTVCIHLTHFCYDDWHYDDVIMTMLASQITSLTVVYSIVYSGVDQSKHQSSASLAFVQEIHRGPVNFPHKWPVTRKMFPFDDVIMWENMCIYLFLLSSSNRKHGPFALCRVRWGKWSSWFLCRETCIWLGTWFIIYNQGFIYTVV